MRAAGVKKKREIEREDGEGSASAEGMNFIEKCLLELWLDWLYAR